MLLEIAIVALLLLAVIQCVLLVLARREARQLQQQLEPMRQDIATLSQQLGRINHTDVPTSIRPIVHTTVSPVAGVPELTVQPGELAGSRSSPTGRVSVATASPTSEGPALTVVRV